MFLLLAICGIVPVTTARARDGDLQPQQSALKKSEAGFHSCKTAAIKEWRAAGGQRDNTGGLKASMVACRELFPTSVDYSRCKKTAIKTHRKDRVSLKQALTECQNNLQEQSFSGEVAVPFWLDPAKRVYFGGIGLNNEIPWNLPGLPGYSCRPLRDAIAKPAAREYFLFGNVPQIFAGLNTLDSRHILGVLGRQTRKKEKTDYVDLRGFGRAYRDQQSYLVFFPSGHCAHESDLAPNYLNIKIYYLLDEGKKLLHPYFGVAFFNPETQTENINVYADLVASRLGSNYQTSLSPNGKYLVISTAAVKEWDAEGDPKNLCRQPRPHHWVAVLKAGGELKDRAEYLLLASVKNLCDYGDQLAGRLKQEL